MTIDFSSLYSYGLNISQIAKNVTAPVSNWIGRITKSDNGKNLKKYTLTATHIAIIYDGATSIICILVEYSTSLPT